MEQPIIICRVREFRTKDRLTQEDLAHELGISRQSIIALESGRVTPSLPLALQLMQYFDIRFTDLFEIPGVPLHETRGVLERTALDAIEDTIPLTPAIPALNVYQTENNFILESPLAGWREEEIAISVENGSLVLAGEKNITEVPTYVHKEFELTHFKRSVQLPEEADPEAIQAKLEHGILRIAIPRKKILPSKVHKVKITR